MGISLKQEPERLTPVGNPIPIVAYSTDYNENNFRYQLLLYKLNADLISYTVILTLYLDPDIDNDGYMVYDLAPIIQNYIDDDISIVKTSGITNTNAYYKFITRVTEYIGTTAGANILSNYLYVSFNGVTQYGEAAFDPDNYEIALGKGTDFLSKKVNRTYKLDSYSTLNFFNVNIDDGVHLYVIVYDEVDVTKYYQMWLPSSGDTTNKIIYAVPLGPANINEGSNAGIWTQNYITPTTADIIKSTTTRYTLHIMSSAYALISEQLTVYLDHNCYRSDGVEFIYRGELGTFETLIANYVDVKDFTTSFNEIKRNQYSISNDSYTYSIGDRGRKVVNRRTNESHTVNTDWLTDSEVTDWLELLNSTDVYINKGGDMYPVLITNTKYSEKTVKNEKLFNYTIAFDMAYEKLSV